MQGIHIALQQLGVVGDDGTVVEVVALILVDIIGQTGVEDRVDALFKKRFDMAVHELGGVTYRVRRDGELSLPVQLARREAGADDLKAQTGEYRVPQRIELIHAQRHRQTDLVSAFLRSVGFDQPALELVQVRELLVLGELDPGALFALVAGDQLFFAVENIDGQPAVVGAAFAYRRAAFVPEIFDLVGGEQRRLFGLVLAGIQRRAERSHQPRDVGTYDLAADLFFKTAQHRVIHKGAALYDDPLSQFIG